MKKLTLFILIVWIISGSCQSVKINRWYYVKIAPIGLSDLPLDTLYISSINIDSIVNTDFNNHVSYVDQKITTDKTTLENIVKFINDYNSNSNYQKKTPFEFGSYNISIHNKTSIVNSYNLDLSDSKKFLNALIGMIEKKRLDEKVAKEIKDKILELLY